MWGESCLIVVFCCEYTGPCTMDNTNARDQDPNMRAECLGQESSLMRRLSLLFHLASLMALSGSNCRTSSIITH